MELQQQQQQIISVESIENSNIRGVITKLINVLLAILAVLLVLVSGIANFTAPFLQTRLLYFKEVMLNYFRELGILKRVYTLYKYLKSFTTTRI